MSEQANEASERTKQAKRASAEQGNVRADERVGPSRSDYRIVYVNNRNFRSRLLSLGGPESGVEKVGGGKS